MGQNISFTKIKDRTTKIKNINDRYTACKELYLLLPTSITYLSSSAPPLFGECDTLVSFLSGYGLLYIYPIWRLIHHIDNIFLFANNVHFVFPFNLYNNSCLYAMCDMKTSAKLNMKCVSVFDFCVWIYSSILITNLECQNELCI